MDEPKGNYKYRLCRARRVVENAFGMLAQKCRLRYRPLGMNMDSAKGAPGATCFLHNYVRTKPCDSKYYEYLEPSEPVVGDLTRMDMEVRRLQHVAFRTRKKFRDFFLTKFN